MRLNEKAMLVKLSISLPGNTRQDKGLTEQVQAEHALGKHAGRWLKVLFPPEAYQPLTAVSNAIRQWNYEQTLAWADDGWRLLPSKAYWDYSGHMRTAKAEFDTARETFMAGWLDWVEWAKRQHNGTFNPAQYDREGTASKFSFGVQFQPLPAGEDFRVALQSAEVQAIQAQIESTTANAVGDAMKDLWHRLADPLRAMVERLKEPDAIFRDTLVGNLKSICGMIPQLNLTDDANLADFASEVATLTVHRPETLRVDKGIRAETAAKANDILQRMNGYLA